MNGQRAVTVIYGTLHFFVDFCCAFFLLGMLSEYGPIPVRRNSKVPSRNTGMRMKYPHMNTSIRTGTDLGGLISDTIME